MVKLEPCVTCVCGKTATGSPGPDGTVACGACGRRVVVDALAAARFFGTKAETVTREVEGRGLSDSTGEPLKLDVALGDRMTATPDGVTQSVSPEPSSRKPTFAPKMPEKLGPYRVLGRLGEGGMGIVYRGHDTALDRPVAIKVLLRTAGAESHLAGLEREARAIAAVAHPNVVQVYSAGEQDGLAYFAMELVSGPDLREVLEREGPFTADRARKAMIQAATGLRAAARKGIFHRDVKPANLLLDRREDQIKVADFGLAKRACVDASLAGTSLIAGTPLYVAPEVIQDGEGDQRADIYSLGGTFYHLLAGAPPFGGRSAADALLGHAKLEPRDLSTLRPDLPADLASAIMRCLAKDPNARFQTYDDLLAALGRPTSGVHAAQPQPAQPAVASAPPPGGPQAPVSSGPRALPVYVAPQPPRAPFRPRKRIGIGAIVLALGGAWVMFGHRPQLLGVPSWPPHVTWTAQEDDEEISCDHELVRLADLVQRSSLPREALRPVTVETLAASLGGGLRLRSRCDESGLPYAVLGRSPLPNHVLVWHVHDSDERKVQLVRVDRSVVEMPLGELLEILRKKANEERVPWGHVVERLRPFLPRDMTPQELLLYR